MILIFLTGAIVLALEVLSSRIMTPYFGVSLYIWAGILSITLTFLAAGYALGGYATRRFEVARHAAIFLSMPIAAAAAIVLACGAYPVLFPMLARFDLVLGSFAASATLLALPLVALSAMNPLLIALRKTEAGTSDGGAGQVFAVSTIGSVAGVLVTAFAIIPNVTNFEALAWLALTLCGSVAVACLALESLSSYQRLRLIGTAIVLAAASAIFLLGQERYLDRVTRAANDDQQFAILEEYSSVFGNLKVVDLTSKSNRYPPMKILLQDGVIQNRVSRDNRSLSMYTYVLDRLAKGFAPNAETALVLGLGAGILPRDMAGRGLDVAIVDINPDVLAAAQRHFGFDPGEFRMALEDARTFVRNCDSTYDVIVVDLFQGDGTPDYLLTKEFFGDLRLCLRPRGIVVMNAFFDPDDEVPNRRLLATVATAFPRIFTFQLPDINSFVVATTSREAQDMTFSLREVPAVLTADVQRSLAAGKLVSSQSLRGIPPLTDRQNLYSILIAEAKLRRRRGIVKNFPPRALVN